MICTKRYCAIQEAHHFLEIGFFVSVLPAERMTSDFCWRRRPRPESARPVNNRRHLENFLRPHSGRLGCYRSMQMRATRASSESDSAPDRVWLADITYLPTGEGWRKIRFASSGAWSIASHWRASATGLLRKPSDRAGKTARDG